MSDSIKGTFSLTLASLQLQLRTLLENSGGSDATNLLDALGELNTAEQKIALNIFAKITKRISGGNIRLSNATTEKQKELEDALYEDIMAVLTGTTAPQKDNKFSILEGGKQSKAPMERPPVIDMEEFKRNRKSLASRPLAN